MHPTALMQSRIHIVGGVEVRAQYALEVFAQQVLNYFTSPRVVVLVVAHLRRTHTPDIAVLAILSPACLIGLHRWTGTDSRLERLHLWLHLAAESVQHLHNLSCTDLQLMQG